MKQSGMAGEAVAIFFRWDFFVVSRWIPRNPETTRDGRK